MKRFGNKKPGSVGRRTPGRQYKLVSLIAPVHSSRLKKTTTVRRKAVLPAPADFYAREIEGFCEGGNGWAHGCCPFHDDHNPSFAMNLETGGYKCLSSHCGVSGASIVSFVCALHGISRSAAYRMLEGLA